MAAADIQETLRHDVVEGWPAPEERAEWFGEPAIEGRLLDAYRSGRMHHAWLLGGPKGIGKATLAYRFARFVLANADPASAGVVAATDLAVPATHPASRKVANRAHPNLLTLERPLSEDRKRIMTKLTVNEVRRTVSFFGTTGGEAGWRIAVIDCADDMNPNAANALLKMLEEPPVRSLLLIVCHAPGRLLPTIRSRCQRIDVPVLSPAAIVDAITREPGVSFDAADMELAAVLADGSLRRAITILDTDGIGRYREFAASRPCPTRTFRRSTPLPTA